MRSGTTNSPGSPGEDPGDGKTREGGAKVDMPQPKVLPASGSSAHHEHARLLPIHEALRDGVWSQDFISEGKKEDDQLNPVWPGI